MNRISFLVDGFNVYHSAKQIQRDLGGVSALWLDLPSLMRFYLPAFGKDARFEEIYYFSALAKHIDLKRPGTTQKHRNYIDCLKDNGVKIELGRFKPKNVWCGSCKTNHVHYEEKETDVAISIKVLELFHRDACDTIILVTGDTDLAPAVRTATSLFPTKEVCFGFPYKRKNKELAQITNKSFRIRKEQYLKHQFSDPYVLTSGRAIAKPATW